MVQSLRNTPVKRKVCSKCGSKRRLSKFNTDSDGKRVGNICIECIRAQKATWRENNREKLQQKQREFAISLMEKINIEKDKPCADCGKRYPPYVMDFDHVDPKTKRKNISDMVRDRFSWNTIKKEIDKCEVVCANCHRERTFKNVKFRVDSKIPTPP